MYHHICPIDFTLHSAVSDDSNLLTATNGSKRLSVKFELQYKPALNFSLQLLEMMRHNIRAAHTMVMFTNVASLCCFLPKETDIREAKDGVLFSCYFEDT